MTVVSSPEVTIGRAELPANVPLRADISERGKLPARAADETQASKTTAKLSLAGTANRIAKFDSNGNLIDSAIFDQNNKVSVGGTTSFGALTLIGNVPSGDAPAMALYNQGGGGGSSVAIDFYNTFANGNIPQAKIKAVDDGAYSDHLTFWTKSPGGPNNSVIERLRVTSTGNVGIGTTNPTARLQVASAGDGATSYTARFQSSSSVYGAGGILFDQNSTYGWKAHTENTGFTTGTLNFSYINGANGLAQAANTLVLHGSGNVGIGTTSPTVAKLQVFDSSVGTAVYGTSAVSGGGITSGGIGVFGDTQAADGVGVWGKNGFGGWAMYAEGNTSQQRNKGGWVKALLKVSAAGGIERCYNAITGSAGGTCGFSVSVPDPNHPERYNINFGFKVDDRFVSVTTDVSFASAGFASVIYNFGHENIIRVHISPADSFAFTVIVY